MKLTGTPAQLKMFEAFASLLKQVPLKQISITAIIKKAQVSRSTFYLYYPDLPAFINDLETKLLTHVEKAQNQLLESAINATAISPSFKTAYPVFLALTTAIDDNFMLFKELTAKTGDWQFIKTIQFSMSDTLFSNLKENLENKAFFKGIPADYAIPMFFSSILTIILHWLQKEQPESAQFVARLITKSRYIEPYQLFKINGDSSTTINKSDD